MKNSILSLPFTPRRYITKEERKIIVERAKGRCEYCQCWGMYSSKSFENDHIEPDSKGGETTLENLANACGGCNGCKYNKTHAIDPMTGKLVLLYNPRLQKWEEHFSWSEDFLYIIGITPIGRATEKALKLNRSGVVNLRRLFKHFFQILQR